MVGYITTDDLWRKWARDRGMTAPASTDVSELAQHYYRAADADAAASDELRALLESPTPTREQVSRAKQLANEARGWLLLVEEAVERAGGWVDPYRSTTVVLDGTGREVPRETHGLVVEVVPGSVRRPPVDTGAQASSLVRSQSVVGW